MKLITELENWHGICYLPTVHLETCPSPPVGFLVLSPMSAVHLHVSDNLYSKQTVLHVLHYVGFILNLLFGWYNAAVIAQLAMCKYYDFSSSD